MRKAKILWFTGLSGSGKSTIADRLAETLENMNFKVLTLDGDNIRNTLNRHLQFTPENIKENNRSIVSLCEKYWTEYDFIIVSVISPFKESREYARVTLSPSFKEIYIRADLQECIRRDVKGLYEKALKGAINNFIGISPRTPYEEPLNPDIVVDTQHESIPDCVNVIMNNIDL